MKKEKNVLREVADERRGRIGRVKRKKEKKERKSEIEFVGETELVKFI